MAFPKQYPLVHLLQTKLDAHCFMTKDALCGFVRVVSRGKQIQMGITKEDAPGQYRTITTTINVTKADLDANDVTGDDLHFDSRFVELWDGIEDRWTIMPITIELQPTGPLG